MTISTVDRGCEVKNLDFQPKQRAPYWHRADVRPVLPHRPWCRIFAEADAIDHPQPVPGLQSFRRSWRARLGFRHLLSQRLKHPNGSVS
jgi:hypothetical protein